MFRDFLNTLIPVFQNSNFFGNLFSDPLQRFLLFRISGIERTPEHKHPCDNMEIMLILYKFTFLQWSIKMSYWFLELIGWEGSSPPPKKKPLFLHIFNINEFFISAITDVFSYFSINNNINNNRTYIHCLAMISQDAKTTYFVLLKINQN